MKNDYLESNSLGPLYPTESIEKMADSLQLKNSDYILDVGGGSNPLPQASVVIDYNLFSDHDRDGSEAKVDSRWLAADIECLPFKDKSFDFSYCSHVLEHVKNPEQACQELMRVSNSGYIETPNKYTEYFAGYPSHRWLIDLIDGVLIFERRWFIEYPMHHVLLAQAQKSSRIYQQGLVHFRNLTCNQLKWEKQIRFKIIENKNWKKLFDYDNPSHAGLSHFYFALNMFANGASVNMVFLHLNIAKEKLKSDYRIDLLIGTVHLYNGDIADAEQALSKARQLIDDEDDMVDPALEYNLKQLKKIKINKPITVQLPMNKGILTNNTIQNKKGALYG